MNIKFTIKSGISALSALAAFVVLPHTLAFAISLPDWIVGDSKPWNLPHKIADRVLDIKFEVSTTVHKVRGHADRASGLVALRNPEDYSTVYAEISIPVVALQTGNESRDRRLWSAMQSDKFPNIKFVLDKVADLCSPEQLRRLHTCSAKGVGQLEIAGRALPLDLPLKVQREDNKYIVDGEVTFDWTRYPIEDPSTFLAKVNRFVTVMIRVAL